MLKGMQGPSSFRDPVCSLSVEVQPFAWAAIGCSSQPGIIKPYLRGSQGLWFCPAFCKSLVLGPNPEMGKCLLLLLLVVLSSLLRFLQGEPSGEHVGGQWGLRRTWVSGRLCFQALPLSLTLCLLALTLECPTDKMTIYILQFNLGHSAFVGIHFNIFLLESLFFITSTG